MRTEQERRQAEPITQSENIKGVIATNGSAEEYYTVRDVIVTLGLPDSTRMHRRVYAIVAKDPTINRLHVQGRKDISFSKEDLRKVLHQASNIDSMPRMSKNILFPDGKIATVYEGSYQDDLLTKLIQAYHEKKDLSSEELENPRDKSPENVSKDIRRRRISSRGRNANWQRLNRIGWIIKCRQEEQGRIIEDYYFLVKASQNSEPENKSKPTAEKMQKEKPKQELIQEPEIPNIILLNHHDVQESPEEKAEREAGELQRTKYSFESSLSLIAIRNIDNAKSLKEEILALTMLASSDKSISFAKIAGDDSSDGIKRFVMNSIGNTIVGLWNAEKTESFEPIEKAIAKQCEKLRQNGFDVQEVLNKIFGVIRQITFSAEPVSPRSRVRS